MFKEKIYLCRVSQKKIMKHLIKYCLFALIVVFISSCIKETSFEGGANLYGPSNGTLKDSLGDCKGIVIKGSYKKNVFLTDSNYLLVNVNVTTPGQYKIYSDTVNGFWFLGDGYVSAGSSTLKIKGFGKPTSALNTHFVLSYKNSACLFTVSVSDTSVVASTPVFRDYFPTTVGSNWGYKIAGLDTIHVQSSPKDTLIFGISHRVFYTSGSMKDTAFYRKSGHNYYRWGSLDGISSFSSLLFLKDDKPVSTQWESNIINTIFSGVPTQIKMRYTLMAVNTTRTVNNNVFDSVIQVKNDLQVKILGTYQSIQAFDTYYAKNVGLIELNIPGVIQQTLKRWKVY